MISVYQVDIEGQFGGDLTANMYNFICYCPQCLLLEAQTLLV